MSATASTSPKAPRERIAFVTGRLAEPALRDLLGRLAPEVGFEFSVIVLEISVAALMTPSWVARRLRGAVDADRLVLPGYCSGELDAIAAAAATRVERGPRDLRSLPRYFKEGTRADPESRPEDYGAYDIEIIAEINHARGLDARAIHDMAARYREHGADVIDVGCDPDGGWTGVGEVVAALRDEGHRVAIDTLDPREIIAGVAAGAELVLSINGGNIDAARAARDAGAAVVAIPDDPRGMEGLDATIATLVDQGVPHRIDPIVEPIGCGFAASLGRYLRVREQWPDAEIMMGIGNLSELTDVDSAGVNTLLIGFCQELGIRSVLTTEVIPWARSAVREIDLARRLMRWAVSHGVPPKHVEPDLVCLRDPELLEHGEESLERLAASLGDPNFRIFAERGELHVMNRDGHHRGVDPFVLFDELGVDDASHAFYLGYEFAKALTALTLGKQYTQDRALRWGFLTREEESHAERRKRFGKRGKAP